MTSGTVELESNGKTYHATWRVDGRTQHVSTAMGQKTTQVGGTPPHILARVMLRELVQEGRV